MKRAKCGCRVWETANGDMEEYICPTHAGGQECPIGCLVDCEHLHIEGDPDDCEFWCEHPMLGEKGEYDDGEICPEKTPVCFECHKGIDEEDVVWIDPSTGDATTSDKGKPFHVECAPAQHKEEDNADG